MSAAVRASSSHYQLYTEGIICNTIPRKIKNLRKYVGFFSEK